MLVDRYLKPIEVGKKALFSLYSSQCPNIFEGTVENITDTHVILTYKVEWSNSLRKRRINILYIESQLVML